jgi:hypothetical protein
MKFLLTLIPQGRNWEYRRLEVLVSVTELSGGYGFPPKLDGCHSIHERSGDHKQRR